MKVYVKQVLQSDPIGLDIEIYYSYTLMPGEALPAVGTLVMSGYLPSKTRARYPSEVTGVVFHLSSDREVDVQLRPLTISEGEKFRLEPGWRILSKTAVAGEVAGATAKA